MSNDHEVGACWDEFWHDLVTDDAGNVDLELVKLELHDYHMLLDRVPKVYLALTGGMLSKPFYDAAVVIQEAEDHFEELTRVHVSEVLIQLREDPDALERLIEEYK